MTDTDDTATREGGQGIPDPNAYIPDNPFPAADAAYMEIHRRAACFDDMLEALRGIERVLLRFMDDPSRADEIQEVVAARQARAKATGGAA